MILVLGLRTKLEIVEADMLENFMTVTFHNFGKRETFASVIVQKLDSLEGCLRKMQLH
jgi:hypothetical protein